MQLFVIAPFSGKTISLNNVYRSSICKDVISSLLGMTGTTNFDVTRLRLVAWFGHPSNERMMLPHHNLRFYGIHDGATLHVVFVKRGESPLPVLGECCHHRLGGCCGSTVVRSPSKSPSKGRSRSPRRQRAIARDATVAPQQMGITAVPRVGAAKVPRHPMHLTPRSKK
jgi:hypothetical protein